MFELTRPDLYRTQTMMTFILAMTLVLTGLMNIKECGVNCTPSRPEQKAQTFTVIIVNWSYLHYFSHFRWFWSWCGTWRRHHCWFRTAQQRMSSWLGTTCLKVLGSVELADMWLIPHLPFSWRPAFLPTYIMTHSLCLNQVFYCPQTKFAKVMFLHLSVSHSVHGGSTWTGTPPGR